MTRDTLSSGGCCRDVWTSCPLSSARSIYLLHLFFSSVSLALRPQACASQSILAWRLTGGMNTSQLAIHASSPSFSPSPPLPFLQDPSLSTYLKVRISCILIGMSIPHLHPPPSFFPLTLDQWHPSNKQQQQNCPPPPLPRFKSIFAISE